MKTVLIALTLLSSLSYANDISMAWVDQKIEEIKPKRNGLSNTTLVKLKSPFIVVRPEVKKTDKSGKTKVSKTPKKVLLVKKKDMSKEPLTLQMILNSSALINAKWLKENDLIRGYKLIQIQQNFVVLKRKKREIKLFIAQKNKNLNISTK